MLSTKITEDKRHWTKLCGQRDIGQKLDELKDMGPTIYVGIADEERPTYEGEFTVITLISATGIILVMLEVVEAFTVRLDTDLDTEEKS